MVETEYVDVSLLDHVSRIRSIESKDTGETTSQDRQDEVPEETMSGIEEYIGDAQARVTVSGDLSSSHAFYGAKAFVSVSVSCNNDMGDVEAVHNILRPFVQKLCHEDHEEMSILRDTVLPPEKRLHTVDSEPSAALPEKVRQPPKRAGTVAVRGGKVDIPKGVKRPSYRR